MESDKMHLDQAQALIVAYNKARDQFNRQEFSHENKKEQDKYYKMLIHFLTNNDYDNN